MKKRAVKIDFHLEKSDNLAEVELHYKSKIKAAERPTIDGSKRAYDILQNVFNAETVEHVESMIVLLLNRAHKVLGWAKISTGGTAGTVCDAKVIFQLALNANASGIILSHNHPSGSIKPSQADIDITKKVREGAKLLDITLLDHLIYTPDGYTSFADEGLI